MSSEEEQGSVDSEEAQGSQSKGDVLFEVPSLPPKEGFEVPDASSVRPKNSSNPEQRRPKVQGRFILKKRGAEVAADSKQPVAEATSAKDDDNVDSSSGRQTDEATRSKTVNKSVPYVEPKWSGVPSSPFQLEVIKGGKIIERIDLSNRSFTVFGRTRGCDVELEHPSISRFHAVVQCRPAKDKEENVEEEQEEEPCRDAFYVYDLGSTHGTAVNKESVRPRTYYRLRLGHMLQFGGSTRMFVLVSGDGDQSLIEADAITEEHQVLEQRLKAAQRFGQIDDMEAPKKEQEEEEDGINWGFQEDAMEEEAVMAERPDFEALAQFKGGKESYYEKDPKKALKAFFDREGLDMEFDVKESGPGSKRTFTAHVQLPIQSPSGAPIYGEASVTGKKRDAILAAALDACRLLDSQDMLREHVSSHKRKKRDWAENDYYDSDEDTFLDRTGTVERKRLKRMQASKASAQRENVETYESLTAKLEAVRNEKEQHKATLEKDRKLVGDGNAAGDSLDIFMTSLEGRLDPGTRNKLNRSVAQLKKEEAHLERLIAIVSPTKLPELTRTEEGKCVSPVEGHQTSGQASAGYGLVTVEKRHQPQAKSPEDQILHQYPTAAVGETIKEDSRKMEDTDPVEKASLPDEHEKEETHGGFSHENNRSQRVLGPARPPLPANEHSPLKSISVLEGDHGHDEQESSVVVDEDDSHKRKRKRERQQQREKKRAAAMPGVSATVAAVRSSKEELDNDPDVASWLPPQDQSGDGRTKLNEKFGY